MKRRVNIHPEGYDSIQAIESENILDALLRARIEVSHACGGMGSCGTCRIRVTSDIELPPRNELEIERANELQFDSNVRLACQLICIEGLKFQVP